MSRTYRVTQEVRELGLHSVVVAEMVGLSIAVSHPELDEIKANVVEEVKSLDAAHLEANECLAGYRELVARIGRSPRKFPPAAEKLIEQIQRSGRFPSINTAVDSYNVVVARRYLALGVHDSEKLVGDIVFRLSPGNEPFLSVGGEKTKFTQPGDYVYSDDRQVLAWLDSKDSEHVKVSLDTTAMVIVIQGTHKTSLEYNYNAAQEACQLVARFCGGASKIQIVV